MNKKGSMELSVNSIVVLVIAIVIMGLILGFIRSKFAEVGGNLVTNEPDPMAASNDDRITLSRETVSTIPGSQAVLKVNIYSPLAVNVLRAAPGISCSGLQFLTVTTNNKTLVANSQTSFLISLAIGKSEQRGKSALCSVNVTAPSTSTSILLPPDQLLFNTGFSPKDFVIQVN